MVTADDVCRVAIFAGLDRADCERLARASADISLQPREYAAHQGADRALFAVLEGTIEAVRLVDGVERVVGEREVGDIFGEVPITLGTVFPVGFRASEESRIMRVELSSEAVFVTHKGERFYFAAEQVVGFRFGGPEARSKHAGAGFFRA